jgi:hypothetical protein
MGVMSGYVKSRNGREVTLLLARQLWSYSSPFVLVDLAGKGPTKKYENRFSMESPCEVEMLEACGIMYCTPKAEAELRAVIAAHNE